MSRHSVIPVVIASFMSILLGCATDSSRPISVATAETEVQLQSIAPGVSVGEYGNQHVVYVSDKSGADWLASSAQQEFNQLSEQYTRTGDTSLQPRLNDLRATLQATAANAGNPFLITTVAESDVIAGPSCTGGDGSSCTCSSGCSCISADRGCGCNCAQ